MLLKTERARDGSRLHEREIGVHKGDFVMLKGHVSYARSEGRTYVARSVANNGVSCVQVRDPELLEDQLACRGIDYETIKSQPRV